MKPKDLQSVIEIRKALIEQSENLGFLKPSTTQKQQTFSR